MNFKTLFFAGLLFMTPALMSAQEENELMEEMINADEDTVVNEIFEDTTFVVPIPKEVESSLDNLIHAWLVQQVDTTNFQSGENPADLTDSIYKIRLSKMPCLMEMPYNRTIKNLIEHYTIRKRSQVELLLGMGDYYFPIFEQVLSANNLPLELKYLPVIESSLNASVFSRVGAAGLWQFMIATGRMYGLEVNSLVDERMDPIKATHAAARFLKDLYAVYGDWNLVIAAYNCGPGNVNKAIRRSGGKRDYWAIYPYLPSETRGYVPIFVAANYTMHYATEHNIYKKIVNMPVVADTIMVRERIHLKQISDVLGLPIEQVRLFNPQYRKDVIPGDIKPYALCLPLNYTSDYIDRHDEIVAYKADSLINNRRNEITQAYVSKSPTYGSGNVIYHKVRSGQTLGHIALKYGISVAKLRKWNNLKGSTIQIGQRLKIHK